MKGLFHILQRIWAVILIAALTVPSGHGLEELFHDHDSHAEHCHLAQHECSEEALNTACHLSLFHGDKSACADHDHFSDKEESCELCLWAERNSSEADLEYSVEILPHDLSQKFSILPTREKQALYSETTYQRGPPLCVS